MSGEIRPPPFPPAQDVSTEPGLGLLALKAENARLRRERNDARRALEEETPPPLPRRRMSGLNKSLIAAAMALAPLLYPIIEHYVPEYAAVIHEIVGLLGRAE